jgi:hypothetical protein
MNSTAQQISALLHEAAETHHVVYRIVDGDDPDWASWYADWLVNLSELPDLLGKRPVRSEVVHTLVSLDREYNAASPDQRWEDWYAERVLERLGAS